MSQTGDDSIFASRVVDHQINNIIYILVNVYNVFIQFNAFNRSFTMISIE